MGLIGQYLGNIFQCTRFSVHVLVLLFVVLKKSWKLSKKDNNCLHNGTDFLMYRIYDTSVNRVENFLYTRITLIKHLR